MMSSPYLWQYIVIFIIIILAIIKMIINIRKASKRKGSCSGCALSQNCMDFKPDKTNKITQPSACNTYNSSSKKSISADNSKCNCHK